MLLLRHSFWLTAVLSTANFACRSLLSCWRRALVPSAVQSGSSGSGQEVARASSRKFW